MPPRRGEIVLHALADSDMQRRSRKIRICRSRQSCSKLQARNDQDKDNRSTRLGNSQMPRVRLNTLLYLEVSDFLEDLGGVEGCEICKRWAFISYIPITRRFIDEMKISPIYNYVN